MKRFFMSLRIVGGLMYLVVAPHLLMIEQTSLESKICVATLGLVILVDVVTQIRQVLRNQRGGPP